MENLSGNKKMMTTGWVFAVLASSGFWFVSHQSATELANANETIENKSEEIKELNTSMTRLDKKVEVLESSLLDMSSELEKKDKSNRELKKKNKGLAKQVEERKASENAKQAEIDLLKKKQQSMKVYEQGNEISSNSNNVEKKESSKESVKDERATVSRSQSDVIERTLAMTATAYTAYCNGCSGVTATGIDLRSNPNQKVIAVDPNVIPLGSKVYVEGYGYAIAGDTGGAIKGNTVDLFMADKSDALKWGRKQVTVRVISKK